MGLALFGILMPLLSAIAALRAAMRIEYGVRPPWKKTIAVAACIALIEWFILACLLLLDAGTTAYWVGGSIGYALVVVLIYYTLNTGILGAFAITFLVAIGQVMIGFAVGLGVSLTPWR